MLNIVQEEAAHPAEKVAVDRRGGSALEVPLPLAVVRQLRRRVMQVGDHDKPEQGGLAIVQLRGGLDTYQCVTQSQGMP